jgi:hypothetical protein
MTTDQLRDFAKRDPFAPFTIHMNDGSRMKITEPDALFVPAQWRFNAIVSLGQDRFTILYLRNVAHISSRGAWPGMGSRRRKGLSGDDE